MLNVLTVPAFQDNYLWLIHDGSHAAVVDPGDARPILAALDAHALSLAAILLTHHHADHVGGVPELLARFPVPVYGPRGDGIATVTQPLAEGDTVELARPALRLKVLDVPGHTRGHIAYHAAEQDWLFCGDTLFAGGCGRLFEGTAEQMAASLSKLAALPEQTQVFCAHEYTLSNLRFAAAVEPGNEALRDRIAREQARRDAGQPTVPSTIGIEKSTNPFLRFRESSIADQLMATGHVSSREPIAVFAALREWKNSFR
ncbi:hydroxyacylglutathione hydrolase [Noviherbaspirillum aridicola]|uniref:Hydroxyacylglutathione hydrolase n=1 Tax=Noviherbaspirillum aridicola TaxID=2849687 RepID=A0ABQ4Q955_9BURK|nr:hydroxyacylglutathione hydrolase [Noviherbaspirillum aridicola]GIZ53597.1 hydroxyacylglutathione hydrolase [Noviherbaspirillum aridicola]